MTVAGQSASESPIEPENRGATMKSAVLIAASTMLWGAVSAQNSSTFKVVGIELAKEVLPNKNVRGSFDPPASCSEERPRFIPVIQSEAHPSIYIWNKINAPTDGQIHHYFYRNGEHIMITRTDGTQMTPGFSATAFGIGLTIEKSSGFRTWSNKNIYPGDWKVEVRTVHAEEEPICVVHFTVN